MSWKRRITLPIDCNLHFIRLLEAYDNLATASTIKRDANHILLEITTTLSQATEADSIVEMLITEVTG
ncbi:hypothetical protein KAH37_07090 [bacterium]|nr:hypothetical protein [bacterium]